MCPWINIRQTWVYKPKFIILIQSGAIGLIEKINNDDGVHGIIVQLPLPEILLRTEDVIDPCYQQQDVDSLTDNSDINSATATAILCGCLLL